MLLGVADEQAAIATSAAMRAVRRCGIIIVVSEILRWRDSDPLDAGDLQRLRKSLRALRRRERYP